MLVGLAGSGKTTYLERLRHNRYTTEYFPTDGFDAVSISLQTNLGQINFEVIELAGQFSRKGMGRIMYKECTGVIFFGDLCQFTVLNRNSFEQHHLEAGRHGLDVSKKCYVYVLNKADITNQQTNLRRLENVLGREMIPISVKTGLRLWQPLLSLAAQLLKENVTMIPQPPQLCSDFSKMCPLISKLDQLIESNQRIVASLDSFQERLDRLEKQMAEFKP